MESSTLSRKSLRVFLALVLALGLCWMPGFALGEANSAQNTNEADASVSLATFPDVDYGPDSWYAEGVTFCSDKGLITGYDSGLFGVGVPLTRAQMVTILWRNADPQAAAAYKNVQATTENTTGMFDVSSYHWYTGAANWAVENNVINGFGGIEFRPDDYVTMQQFVTILANYCASSDRDAADLSYLFYFVDGWQTDTWAQYSIAWATEVDLVHGYDRGDYRELCPKETISRQRAATILKSAFDKGVLTDNPSDGGSGDTDPDQTTNPDDPTPEPTPTPDSSTDPTPTPNPDTTKPDKTTDPLKIDSSVDNPASLNSGESCYLYTNNVIKSVASSNSSIMTYELASNKSLNVYAKEPGNATLTITDINGSTATFSAVVTKVSYSGDKTFTATRYDSTIAAPSFNRLDMSSYLTYTNMMWLEWRDSATNYDGYEVWYSNSPDFDKINCKVYANSYKPSDGCHYTNFTVGVGDSYYVKVRAFTCDGDTQVAGNWSEVKQIDSYNYNKEASGSAQYSYEIFNLNTSYSDLYSGCSIPVFIKTDAPSANPIRIVDAEGKSVIPGSSANANWSEHEGTYDDIYYSTSDDRLSDLRKVEGGYVGVLKLSAGQQTIRLLEDSKDGYVVGKTMTVSVLDTTAEREAWMQSVLDSCTTSSMTSFEKMSAVCNYLLNDLGFRYLTNDGASSAKLLTLATQPNSPYFVSYRWDSYTSPAVLCEFADLIGGFDDIHNCYNDYPRGSAQWSSMHYLCRVTIGSDVRYYQACPFADSGVVSYSLIDFSNTSAMNRLG